MTAIILDTETTSVDEPEVIQMAWGDLNSDWSLSMAPAQNFQPTKAIQWGAMATHHILPVDLIGCAPSQEAKMPPCDYLIGHNIDFDWKALGSPIVKRIDTLALSRLYFEELDSHKLGAMVYATQGAHDATRRKLRNAHDATCDVLLCYELLLTLKDKLKFKTLEELYKLSEDARIPRKMTFGKHKGELVKDVPAGYRKWYRQQADTDPYLLMAFSKF